MRPWYSVEGSSDYFVREERACYVPGAACPACRQTWADSGAVYPSVDCKRLPPALRREAGTAPPAELRALIRALNEHFGDDRPIFPGSEFGPPTGPIKRKPTEVFREMFGLFIAPEVAEDRAFRALGVTAVPFVARTVRSGQEFRLHEIEAWPMARRAIVKMQRTKLQHCEVCGYRAIKPYNHEPLLASSLEGRHIVRGLDAATFIFVSEALRTVLEPYRWANELEFKPIKVV